MIVDVDGVGEVEFPDEMPPEQIKQVLQKKFPPKQQNRALEALGNVPQSAANYVGDIASAVMNPVDTVKGLWDAAAGGLQNAAYAAAPSLKPQKAGFMYDPNAEKVADAVGGFYKDRYGGMANAKETLVKDPVGALGDLAGVVTLAGAGLRTAGLSKAGQSVGKAGSAIDPLSIVGKTAQTVTKKPYTWLTGTTTGSGAQAIDEALKASPEFVDAMRGTAQETDVLGGAVDSLDKIKESRRLEYQSKLSSIQNKKAPIKIDDVKARADTWLERYNIKKVKGELDFSRSTVTGKAADEVGEIYKMVSDWGSKKGDLTPANLDILKRRISDSYSSNRSSRAMISDLSKVVHNKISSVVPEYGEMTKGYAKSSEVIRDIEKALSIGNRASADTALRKLMTAIREDKTFRRSLIEQLDQAGGNNVMGGAAGLMMKPAWSQRLGPMLTASTAGVSAIASPKMMALLPLASPRVVGEFSVLMGRIGKAAPKLQGAGLAAAQAGGLPLE